MRDWKSLVRARLEPLPLDPVRAADIVDELAQHVADHHAELVASGLSDEEAVCQALAPLANRAAVARDIAAADRPRICAPPPPSAGGRPLAGVLRDIRYAARRLARAPGFSAVAVLTLGLGIGANTAIFSVVRAVLLRPLPYAEPGRLALVGERGAGNAVSNVGYTTFLDWKSRTHSFDDLALVRDWSATLVADGEPQRIAGMRVSANYFRLLGVAPALGRDFSAADDDPQHWRVLMLSDGLWRRRFNADPSVVGRVVTISDRDYTITGVMPAAFEELIGVHFYQHADAWSLVGYDPSLSYACRSCQHLRAIGRLKHGVTIDAAAADVNALHAQLQKAYPTDYDPKSTIAVQPLQSALTDGTAAAVALLMGAVVFVLLIGCANVANLLLARMAARGHELALRAALGAGRARLLRQLMIESGLLAAVGGAIGVGLGFCVMPVVVSLAPPSITRVADFRIDAAVLLFSGIVSLSTAVAFGLLPALRASRVDLQSALHGDRRSSGSSPTSLTRRLLVAVEVALAMVLLAGAGLMIRSVERLLNVDPGFSADHVLTMQTALLGASYATSEQVAAKTSDIVARLHTLAGVEAVALASQIPLGGNGDRFGFHIKERPSANPANDPSVERYGVTPEYFEAMRIPLRRGRFFTDADRPGSEEVLIVGEETARTLWPHADPIGQHVRVGDAAAGPWRTVVGIAGDVRHSELAMPPTLQMYTPQAQVADSFLTIVIRARGDAGLLAAGARRAIWSVAPDVPVYEAAELRDLVAKSVGPRRFVMVLLEWFGALALLMTAIGVYGVISCSVAERTCEIGIRAALGATRRDIVRLVVGGELGVVLAGLAAGVLLALGATRFLEGSLYGVSDFDPATYVTVALLLLVVAAIAQGVPVRRAIRVDPSAALRQD